MKNIFVILTIMFWMATGYAQYPAGHIPASDRQEWSKAGLLNKNIPYHVDRIINFKTVLNGIGENDEKMVQILDDLTGDEFTVIYFPEGDYTFYETININKNNVVLLGAGSEKTKIYFENNKTDPCILAEGSGFNTTYDINDPVFKGSKIITAYDIPDINNQWVHFYEKNNGYGQITRVSTYGNQPIIPVLLELKDKATKNYKTDDLQIALFTPRKNIGIENLMIKKNTSGKGDGGISIYFVRAVNCWVKGVESAYTSQHHVAVVHSSHIEISGNYFHHAQNYGEGGFGYGVMIHHNSTNCLVENNVLKHLRHSIALQKGANCNVVTYNYSYDRRSYNDDIFSPENQSCDLVLHGNYAWGNLFEQNNVAAIAADNTHGKNGPYNVFIRNRTRGDGIISLQPGWYPIEYGLVLYKAAHTSLLGNVISNDDVEYNASDLAVNIFARSAAEGEYEDWSNIGHRGSAYRNAKDNPNSYFMYDESYHYNERPAFLPDEYTYPSIGPKPMSGLELTQNIPAYGRVNNNLTRTVNLSPAAFPALITLIIKTDDSIDTSVYNVLNVQAIEIADSIIHPESGEKYFFAGIESDGLVDFNDQTNEISPGFAKEKTYTVLYKKLQRSSTKDAYSRNSKRKFIKDSNGSLYNVYESMGHVFLEIKKKSAGWKLLSGNQPNLFLDKNGGKSPALDYAKQDENYDDVVGIIFQEGHEIEIKTVQKQNDTVVFGPQLESIPSGIEKDIDLRPNIAWGGRGIFLALWEDSVAHPGINFRLYQLSDVYTLIDSGIVAGTDNNSRNIAVSSWFEDSTSTNYFDIVWEQHQSSSKNNLQHLRATYYSDGSTAFSESFQISKSSFDKNTNATVVSLPEGAMVTWLARNRTGIVRTAMRNAVSKGNLYLYGRNAKSTTINKFNDNSGYYFGWSSYNSGKWYNNIVTSENLSQTRNEIPLIRIVSNPANEFQLSSCNNINDIDAIAFYHDSAPYYFKSLNLEQDSFKPQPFPNASKGFNFSNNTADFDYMISEIKVDNERITFDDKLSEKSRNVFYSDNFYLPENLRLQFEENFGIFYPADKNKLLSNNDYILIKLELIDNDNRILDTIKEINLTRESLKPYSTKSFVYTNNRITNSLVKIRISLQTNVTNSSIYQLNYYLDERIETVDQVVEEIDPVKDFELNENYPNPFNPLTKIHYQVSKRTRVSIRVYDILGREVATLVNEEKDPGKYTAVFNALGQAGGLYIYKMQAGTFSKAKKMVLIK